MGKIKLSIIIVTYNDGEYLLNCLSDLSRMDDMDIDIWVVDNASTDGSIEEAKTKFPDIKYIVNSENLGFSKANNLALKKVNSEYILLLNADTKIKKGILGGVVNFLENNLDVGAVTPKIVLPNGKIDLTAHRGFPTPWASFKYYFLNDDSLYHLTNQDMFKIHEVDAITGAFFMTRKSILEKVGYLDESFFMYGEDIELCFRIKKAGYKIMYLPEYEVLHYKGVSSGLKKHSQDITTADRETRNKALNAFYQAMIIFYKKHLEKNYPGIVNWMVYLGINLKWQLAKRRLTV